MESRLKIQELCFFNWDEMSFFGWVVGGTSSLEDHVCVFLLFCFLCVHEKHI